jgi:hypothetical protein
MIEGAAKIEGVLVLLRSARGALREARRAFPDRDDNVRDALDISGPEIDLIANRLDTAFAMAKRRTP